MLFLATGGSLTSDGAALAVALREKRADEVSGPAGPLTYRFLGIYWVYGEWDHLNGLVNHHQTLVVMLSNSTVSDKHILTMMKNSILNETSG